LLDAGHAPTGQLKRRQVQIQLAISVRAKRLKEASLSADHGHHRLIV
jgi:hypothetical protein